ncbi:hypothetical protein AALA17_06885 [Lactobacillaceae bacterium 24-114]
MKQNKFTGFVLADSLIALSVITISITFIFINRQALIRQREDKVVKLEASRLAKECSDELRVDHGKGSVQIHRNGYVASANRQRVKVTWQGKEVINVE